MTGMRSGRLAGAGITLGILLAAGTGVRAQPSVIEGQAVGHVVLGMQRADVWKVLKKPTKTYTVPHGTELYGEDEWTENGCTLTVVSEHDKVVQVEFNSPRMTTADGLTADSTLAQVRRRHPTMTVRAYWQQVSVTISGQTSLDFFYLDDVRGGVAFTYLPPEEGMPRESDELAPKRDDELKTIIIHRPNGHALPIVGGQWSAAGRNPEGLRLLRGWFTPGASKARH